MRKKIILGLMCWMLCANAYAQNTYCNLTELQMQADLEILQSAWTKLHPGLYRYNSPQQIAAYFDTLRAKCAKPLDERLFYIYLSQLATKVKCGHTYLNPLNLSPEVQKRFLPARMIPFFFEVMAGNKIILTHNLSQNQQIKRGDEIISINGISAKRIIDSLLTVSRSDGNHAMGKKLNNINESPDEAKGYSLFDIYFPLFFPSKKLSFRTAFRPFGSVRIKFISVNSTKLANRIATYEKQFGNIPVGEKSWNCKTLNPRTAYMKFGTFAFWNGAFNERRYIDSCFHELAKKKEVRNLIIDIRNNEGGDNTGNYILSYITDHKIGCEDRARPCYRYLAIPEALLAYLDTWDNSFKRPKDTSKYFKNELGLYELKNRDSTCEFIEVRPNHFTGRVYLLTNARNSSATYEMARKFKAAELGKIIGAVTGGTRQGINGGEFFFLTLPNSKFEIDLPLIYGYHPNTPDEGILPDFEIKTQQKDIRYENDPQLQFALALIAKEASL